MGDAEAARLTVLYGLGVLDTPREERFDRITRLACQVLDMPMGMVSLVDEDRLWAKSRVGTDIEELPREQSFCDHTVRQDGPFVVPDAKDDPRFQDNPLVARQNGIRFYAGAPMKVKGQNIGALCIFDSEPRKLTADEERILVELGRVARDEIEDVAARAAEATLRSIVRATPDAIVVADHRGLITEFNPAAEQLFGYPRQEAIGQSLTSLMPERYRARHQAGFDRFLATGEAHVIGNRVELEALHRDGHEIPVELSLAASVTSEGLAFTGILRDLRRRKQLEEERLLRRMSEQQLAQAQEMTRLRAEFINQASHELYTPLTPILLQLQLLRDKLPGHEQDFLVLERNTRRLQGVIEQVIRMSRLQQQPSEPRPLDLADVLQQAAAVNASAARRRGIVLEVNVPELPIIGDAAKLHDAFFGIIENAVRHTPPGGRVTVTAEVDQVVLISVEDTGPGIPQGNEDLVFHAFYKIDPTAPGWGLGLFIAKDVVQWHGGSVEVLPGPRGRVVVRLPHPTR